MSLSYNKIDTSKCAVGLKTELLHKQNALYSKHETCLGGTQVSRQCNYTL